MAVSGTSSEDQAGERSCGWDAAYERGMRAVAGLGWTAELRQRGEDPGMWACRLLEADGTPVPDGAGSGKGYRVSAQVGAVFEALEHHFSGMSGVPAQDVVVRPVSDVAGALAGDVVGAQLAEYPDGWLGCFAYRSLADDAEAMLPVLLSCPDYLEEDFRERRHELGDTYDYSTLERYSVDSGCAAGSTRNEAVVHALNEIIENDSVSLMVIRSLLTSNPARLTVFDPRTLPRELGDLHRIAQQRSGKPVYLVDTTTDLGVPAVFAYLPAQPGNPVRIRGAGASLSREHAIRRALTELLQLMAGHNTSAVISEKPVGTTGHPLFHNCYLMDLQPNLLDAEVVPYTATSAPNTPAGHLDELVRILTGHGHTPYIRTVHSSDVLDVVSALVPGLERFLLVTDGHLVIPGPRGLTARPVATQPT